MKKSQRSAMLSLLRGKRKKKSNAHEEHEAHCTSLCCAGSGQRVCIRKLIGCETEASRLRDLGLREGATVQVLRDGDPLMVRVADARFGIGRSAAMNVLCEIQKDTRQCKLP